MNRFSFEILGFIFKYLNTKQKLQCKLVCKSWAHVLLDDVDLGTLVIPSNECRSFIEKMKTNRKSSYNYCRRLTVSNYYDLYTLVTLFPDLNFLYFSSPSSSGNESTETQQPHYTKDHHLKFRHWHNNLKVFIDFSSYNLLFTFLDTGIFRKLTTLVLISSTIRTHPFTVHKLKNTPNLTTLHVQGVTIGLESLHKNVPRLHSLVLSTCVVELEEEKRFLPAKTMKKFEMIKYAGSNGFSIELSRYIVSKYPNLEEFGFKMHECGKRGNKGRDALWTSSFIYLVRNTKLTSFKAWVPISIPHIYNAFIEENKNTLRRLTTNIFNEKLLFDKMMHICDITGLYSLSLTQVPPLDSFSVFNRLVHLKVLKLKFTSKFKAGGSKFRVELSELTNELPTSVEILGLICVDVYLSEVAVQNNANIRHLKIKFSRIKNDLSDYLSYRFKKLDTLILDRCMTDFDLSLPYHHLQLVKIYVYKHLMVSVNGDTQPILYSAREQHVSMKSFRRKVAFDVHDDSMYTTCIALPFLNNKQYFHLKCASVHTLLLGEELVLL